MLQRIINITLFAFIAFTILVIIVGMFQKERKENQTKTGESTETQQTTTTQQDTTTQQNTTQQQTQTQIQTQTTKITLSNSEIAKHSSRSDCWLLISGKVYDVTTFLRMHPGGGGLITPFCGKDATIAFNTQDGQGSHSGNARAMLGDYILGNLNETITK